LTADAVNQRRSDSRKRVKQKFDLIENCIKSRIKNPEQLHDIINQLKEVTFS